MRAAELMQSEVITVTPETPLLNVHRLFLEEEINGAPVVDARGRLVGVISSLDLIHAVLEGHDTLAVIDTSYFTRELHSAEPDWVGLPKDLPDKLADITVEDAMVTELVTVRPDTDVAEVAQVMRDQRIHRVLVVEDGVLLGIITAFDLIALLAQTPATREAGPQA